MTTNLSLDDELNEIIEENSKQQNQFANLSIEEAEYQAYLNFMKHVHKPYQDSLKN